MIVVVLLGWALSMGVAYWAGLHDGHADGLIEGARSARMQFTRRTWENKDA